MKVLFDSLFIQLLATPYIAWRGGQLLPRGGWRLAFRGILLLQLLYVAIAVLLRHSLPSEILSPTIAVTCSWFLLLLYLVPFAMLINGGRRLFERIKHRSVREMIGDHAYRRCKTGILIFSIAGSVALLTYGYHNAATPQIVHREIMLSKPLGRGLKRVRVMFVSDLHFGETIGRPFAERLLSLYREHQPDIFLVGGDVFDYSADLAYTDGIPDIIRQINPPLGSFYIYGNHEYRGDIRKKADWIRLVGGTLLVDSVASPHGVLTIIGRDDYTHRNTRASLDLLSDQITSETASLPRILLDHQPHHLDSVAHHGIDLALFGHTHDGQIFPFSLVVRASFEKAHGFIEKGETKIYVSSGYGAAGPAIRFFTDSEIVLLDLVSPPSESKG